MPEPNASLAALWSLATQRLKAQIGPSSWSTWFAAVEPLQLDDDLLVLGVPAEVIQRRILDQYVDALDDAVATAADRRLKIDVILTNPSLPTDVEPTDVEPTGVDDTSTGPAGDLSTAHAVPSAPLHDLGHPPRAAQGPTAVSAKSATPPQGTINPTNTFDTFIIGESNRFAHAAALAVAEAPGEAYNPLFIYGDTGLGKTHLLHAIVNMARSMGTMRATYTTSEQFTNQFIEMIRSDSRQEFWDRHRGSDILLIDDIQFLAGKEQTQNELFHTFNHLYEANRQIVIASDRPPREISPLEARLRSRFESGLLTDVQPPDLETRIAILRTKAEHMRLEVPPEVLETVAERISDNIRALEGALNKLNAYASLEKEPINLATTEDLLEGLGAARSRIVTSDVILTETADYYQISLEDLLGPSRRRPLVNARQIAMYVHRDLTDLSLPRIGEIFGGRDHTTVLHACRKVGKLMAEKRKVFQEVNDLQTRIKTSGDS